jgi:hypothetical protein
MPLLRTVGLARARLLHVCGTPLGGEEKAGGAEERKVVTVMIRRPRRFSPDERKLDPKTVRRLQIAVLTRAVQAEIES